MLVEIVTHCWSGPKEQYAALLACQLNSLCRHPPQSVSVTCRVYCDHKDSAASILLDGIEDWIPDESEDRLRFVEESLPRELLLQRAIGRHAAAISSKADIVWFADCDFCFGPGCLDSLAALVERPEKLFMPGVVFANVDYEHGQKYIDERGKPLDPADFAPTSYNRAIGGIQIVHGDTARQGGYVPHLPKYHEPTSGNSMIGFGADKEYRKQLGSAGTKVDIPNVYRIRHAMTGDHRTKVPNG